MGDIPSSWPWIQLLPSMVKAQITSNSQRRLPSASNERRAADLKEPVKLILLHHLEANDSTRGLGTRKLEALSPRLCLPWERTAFSLPLRLCGPPWASGGSLTLWVMGLPSWISTASPRSDSLQLPRSSRSTFSALMSR